MSKVQFSTLNKLGQRFYLYKQSTMTSNKGKVTMHFFTKNPDFSKTVQPATKVPRGYFIHEDPFSHRITCPPLSELDAMLKSVYEPEGKE